MNRGAGHQRTFYTRQDGLEFERLLGEGHDRFGVEVHAYCLMPNHYHLLVHCPMGDLGRFMQHVAGVYTQRVNDRRGRDGALFRGRYHALTVHDERYLLAAARYIHRNPLALGTAPLSEYRWSSHATYLGVRARPRWLRTETVLDFVAGGRAAFAEMVEDPAVDFWSAVPEEHLLDFIGLVVEEVDPTSSGNAQKANRTIAMELARRIDGDTRARIMTALGFDDHLALERAVRRAEQRTSAEPVLREIVDTIHRHAA